MARFVELERRFRQTQEGERRAVLLIADDEETLRKTHSHYVMSFDELLASVKS